MTEKLKRLARWAAESEHAAQAAVHEAAEVRRMVTGMYNDALAEAHGLIADETIVKTHKVYPLAENGSPVRRVIYTKPSGFVMGKGLGYVVTRKNRRSKRHKALVSFDISEAVPTGHKLEKSR